MSLRDLFVVVPDLDTENTVIALLTKRQDALGISLNFDPQDEVDLLRWAARDSGCYRDAVDLLRPKLTTHRHALVIFDRHGCGDDDRPRAEIEQTVENRLQQNGWPPENVAVIAIDPEIEAWVWSASPNVAQTLGWQNNDELKAYLVSKGVWNPNALKPSDPKEALKLAWRAKKNTNQVGLNAALFAKLARTVGLKSCQDAAFQKLRQSLTRWFGVASFDARATG
jgi:hypothetical protein